MTITGEAMRQLSSSMEGTVTDIGYDSYATAWRYLGAYIDCGDSDSGSGGWSSWWNGGRRLDEEGSDDDEGSYSYGCSGGTRKVLWAAYYNPDYVGDQIGEYEYYADGEWDNSTCAGANCTKMDCHDPWMSSWELLGVYKESVDFDNDNFFEQLFKHQGYCLWDGDKEGSDDSQEEEDGQEEEDSDSGDSDSGDSKSNSQDYSGWESSSYQFMQAMRNELPSGCTQVGDLTYGSQSNYYIAIKPLPEGDMTLGVYLDSACEVEAGFTFSDYQNYAASSLTSTGSSGAFDTWNDNMDAYKICQPCRAYNRQQTYQSERARRQLTEEDDGQGDEEQNGYNCYDDAHYQNCNQCYKFETHTDMETASASDLEDASAQGTMLLFEYDGTWYGNGTVGDVEPPPIETNASSYQDGYDAGYEAGLAAAYGSANVNASSYGSASVNASSYGSASVNASSYGSTSVNASSYGSASVNASSYGSASVNASSYGSTSVNASSYGSASVNASTYGSASVNASSYGSASVNASSYGSASVNASSYGSASNYDDSVGTSYAFAGGAVVAIFGVAVGAFRKVNRRSVALTASEGTTPSTTSPPLV